MKKLGNNVCYNCENLKTIYIEDDCEANLFNARVPYATKVGPLPDAMLGNMRIWDIRKLKHVTIPEDVEKIGNYWFRGADIESVIVPANVREIGTEAFCRCYKLRNVMFEEGSKLEKMGDRCFASTGLEEITLPRTLKEIDAATFRDCGNLKAIYVEDGCEASLYDAEVPDYTEAGPLPETMIGNTRVWDLRR